MNNTFEKFMKTLNENVRITGNILNEITVYKGDGISISINRGKNRNKFSKRSIFQSV